MSVHRRCLRPTAAMAILLTATWVIGLSACNRPESSAKTAPDVVRIVSLSPALTRTMVDLEIQDLLVGRSRFCDAVDQDIPAVGDLFDIDYERLTRLQPTHVVIQPAASGIAPELQSLSKRQGWTVQAWPLNTIDDVRTMTSELAQGVAARLPDRHDAITNRASALDAALQRAATPLDGNVRTLVLQGLDPVLAAGTSTYVDELLRAAGGVNAVSAVGWAELSLEDVVRLNPEVIIVLHTGQITEDAWNATALATLSCDAVRNDRIDLIASDAAMLPSSALATLLDPFQRAVGGSVSVP
ncbi:MAG: ABC transporter substrate-binding protein [Planctomycetota bacterium]